MGSIEDRLFVLHAEVCKAMANPIRLKILNALQQGEQSVHVLAKTLKLRKANLSQHLAILRQRGIVATRREGLNIYYRCANPKMLKACDILREVLLEQLAEGGRLIEQAGKRPSARRARRSPRHRGVGGVPNMRMFGHSAAATMAAASEE